MAEKEYAPKPGCKCQICVVLRRRQPWVPVILSRDPFHGKLMRGGQQDAD